MELVQKGVPVHGSIAKVGEAGISVEGSTGSRPEPKRHGETSVSEGHGPVWGIGA